MNRFNVGFFEIRTVGLRLDDGPIVNVLSEVQIAFLIQILIWKAKLKS